jgi:hypothetical protein
MLKVLVIMNSLEHAFPDNKRPSQDAAHEQADPHGAQLQGAHADSGAAATAADIQTIRKTVEDAAVSTGLWMSYLFTLLYIAIGAGAVSHLDLLLENSVRLPY